MPLEHQVDGDSPLGAGRCASTQSCSKINDVNEKGIFFDAECKLNRLLGSHSPWFFRFLSGERGQRQCESFLSFSESCVSNQKMHQLVLKECSARAIMTELLSLYGLARLFRHASLSKSEPKNGSCGHRVLGYEVCYGTDLTNLLASNKYGELAAFGFC